jgi:DNA-binding transcriptional regulator PaaX
MYHAAEQWSHENQISQNFSRFLKIYSIKETETEMTKAQFVIEAKYTVHRYNLRFGFLEKEPKLVTFR